MLDTLERRFWEKVRPTAGCWTWEASLDGRGYGQIAFKRGGKGNMRAHRVSWEIHNGPIPDDLHVLHRCDNPPCVNPDHLFLGTQRDNVQDMWAKGRASGHFQAGESRGVKNVNAKLDPDKVTVIRERAQSGESYASLARSFNVTGPAISSLVRRRTWHYVV